MVKPEAIVADVVDHHAALVGQLRRPVHRNLRARERIYAHQNSGKYDLSILLHISSHSCRTYPLLGVSGVLDGAVGDGIEVAVEREVRAGRLVCREPEVAFRHEHLPGSETERQEKERKRERDTYAAILEGDAEGSAQHVQHRSDSLSLSQLIPVPHVRELTNEDQRYRYA